MTDWPLKRILGLALGVALCIFGVMLAFKALKVFFSLFFGLILLFIGYTLLQRFRPG